MRDAPWIEDYEGYFHADLRLPHCPVCGKVCDTVYYDARKDIMGCDHCLDYSFVLDNDPPFEDAWSVDECFAEPEPMWEVD